MSSIVISGDSSGTVTLAVPSAAGTNTATLPAATGTVMVSGNIPTFSYYQSSAQTGLASGSETKITFTTSEFDTTGGMYSSSRFTPTVSGYYQINACVYLSGSIAASLTEIRKNGSVLKFGDYQAFPSNVSETGASVSSLVYCNGSTDYIEIYVFYAGTGTASTNATQPRTWFNGCLVRSA